MPLPNNLRKIIEKYHANKLDLRDAGLMNNDMLELGEILSKKTSITGLNLSRNNFGDEGIKVFMLYLPKNICELNLSDTNIGDRSAEILANSHLKCLSVVRTSLTEGGAKIFAQQAKQEIIYIDNYRISEATINEIKTRTRLNNFNNGNKTELVSFFSDKDTLKILRKLNDAQIVNDIRNVER